MEWDGVTTHGLAYSVDVNIEKTSLQKTRVPLVQTNIQSNLTRASFLFDGGTWSLGTIPPLKVQYRETITLTQPCKGEGRAKCPGLFVSRFFFDCAVLAARAAQTRRKKNHDLITGGLSTNR